MDLKSVNTNSVLTNNFMMSSLFKFQISNYMVISSCFYFISLIGSSATIKLRGGWVGKIVLKKWPNVGKQWPNALKYKFTPNQ